MEDEIAVEIDKFEMTAAAALLRTFCGSAPRMTEDRAGATYLAKWDRAAPLEVHTKRSPGPPPGSAASKRPRAVLFRPEHRS